MKTIVPDYYPDFRCIAGACRHSCSIGWEIDIDEDTRQLYREIPGEIGRRLSEQIDDSGEVPCFSLDERERCPFLNGEGLCDIILQLGEGALCQICADHPRFRSFFSDRTEMGLGLCCEAAADLILRRTEPVRFTVLEDDGETESLTDWERTVLAEREGYIRLAQDRTLSAKERMERIAVLPPYSFAQWTEILLRLEQMDPAWGELLRRTAEQEQCAAISDTAEEQLLVYFLFRHLPDAVDLDDLYARAAFAVVSTQIIAGLAARLPETDLREIARLYSSEIEYSEENTEALLAILRGAADAHFDKNKSHKQ